MNPTEGKPVVHPDLEWYAKIGSQRGLPVRCPYATAGRCPRFYQSLSLLGSAGSTEIAPEEDRRLEAFWKATDLWPLTAEQASSISGSSNERKMFLNFCPEVSFLRFGLFAADLIPYSDAEARESEQNRLAAAPMVASQKDYRWDWWRVHEMHFSECPLYSLLPIAPLNKPAHSSETELLEMKPSVAGFTLNLKVLFTKMALWWLKKQTPKTK